ncbi:hypothetical protein BSL78_07129 [Apostichopus japonicus]|uniref:Uncharacterized protein n=1 Tax=Stichopus japonicus TaxID=307972 RepID=A0A2G8L6T6_STIJA|nr:hypothetical protein BSL78_07129 [Apostichopus japonicus]
MALEELLELLRLFLSKTQEYLNLLHGRRSFIRYVGEHLPIGPVRRIQFKYINGVQHHSQSLQGKVDCGVTSPVTRGCSFLCFNISRHSLVGRFLLRE